MERADTALSFGGGRGGFIMLKLSYIHAVFNKLFLNIFHKRFPDSGIYIKAGKIRGELFKVLLCKSIDITVGLWYIYCVTWIRFFASFMQIYDHLHALPCKSSLRTGGSVAASG